MADWNSSSIYAFDTADGTMKGRVLGSGARGKKDGEFDNPGAICVTADGALFVVDCNNRRVQQFTPDFGFVSVIGTGVLQEPCALAASMHIVAVSDTSSTVCVFDRRSGAFLRRFGSRGSGSEQLSVVSSMCFLGPGTGASPADHHLAVADHWNHRISVFDASTGAVVRHVSGVTQPADVAFRCSNGGELIVVCWEYLWVFGGEPSAFAALKNKGNGCVACSRRGSYVYMTDSWDTDIAVWHPVCGGARRAWLATLVAVARARASACCADAMTMTRASSSSVRVFVHDTERVSVVDACGASSDSCCASVYGGMVARFLSARRFGDVAL